MSARHYARLKAAEEVCFSLLLMMAFGELEIPRHARKFLSEPYGKWIDLAIATGVVRDDEGEAA